MYPRAMRRLLLGSALALAGCHCDRGSSGISADPTPRASASTSSQPLGPPSVVQEKFESHDEVDVTLSWPRIDLGGGRAGAALTAIIEKDLKSSADELRKDHHDAVVADADAGSPFLDHWSLDVECTPTLVSHRLVSVACQGYDFEGGAHGMPTTFGFVYEIVDDAPEEVELQSVVGAAGVPHLAPPCLASLKKQGSTYALDGTLDAKAIVESSYLQAFVLNREGLTFVFPPYSAGPYAEGEYVVNLDWATVRAASTDPREVDRLRGFAEEPGAISAPFGEERDPYDAGP